MRLAAVGVLPAFALFGFYKLWVSALQYCSSTFYREKLEGPASIDEELEPLTTMPELDRKYAPGNLVTGVAYVAAGLCAAAISRCLS